MANRKHTRLLYRLIGLFMLGIWSCGGQPKETDLTAMHIVPAGHSIPLGRLLQFRAIGTFSDNSNQDISQNIQWNTSDSHIATISNESDLKGLLITLQKGQIIVSAKVSDSRIHAVTEITVTEPVLEAISVVPSQAWVRLGLSQQFQAMGHYSDDSAQDLTAVVDWSSPDALHPTVSNTKGSKGLSISPKEGRATIVATDPASGLKGRAVLFLSDARLTMIDIMPKNLTLALGNQSNLLARGIFSDGNINDITAEVTWLSSNPQVASVSDAPASKGLTVAKLPGTAVIKAVDPDLMISAGATVNISGPELLEISIFAPVEEAVPGRPIQLEAVGRFTDGQTNILTDQLDWSLGDRKKATMDNQQRKGYFCPMQPGLTRAQATDPHTGKSATLELAIGLPQLTNLVFQLHNKTLYAGEMTLLKATGIFSDGSKQDVSAHLEWSSSSLDVARISNGADGSKMVLSIFPGQAAIIAFDSKTGISAADELTVEPARLIAMAIAPENPAVALGKELVFNALGTFSDKTIKDISDQVTWHSSNPSVASTSHEPDSKGIIYSKSIGDCRISAVFPPLKIQDETRLMIIPPELVAIELIPEKLKLILGSSHQIKAMGKFSDGGTKEITTAVAWSASDETVANIGNLPDNKGLAMAKTIGYCDIAATDPASGLSAQTKLICRVNNW